VDGWVPDQLGNNITALGIPSQQWCGDCSTTAAAAGAQTPAASTSQGQGQAACYTAALQLAAAGVRAALLDFRRAAAAQGAAETAAALVQAPSASLQQQVSCRGLSKPMAGASASRVSEPGPAGSQPALLGAHMDSDNLLTHNGHPLAACGAGAVICCPDAAVGCHGHFVASLPCMGRRFRSAASAAGRVTARTRFSQRQQAAPVPVRSVGLSAGVCGGSHGRPSL